MVYLLGNEVDQWYICVETRLLGKQLHWHGFMGLSSSNVTKKNKGTKIMLKFSLGLYCLVVMFLLLYVICVFLEQTTHGKAKENEQKY